MASKYIIMNRIYFLIFMAFLSCHSPDTEKSEVNFEAEADNQSFHTYALNANVRVGKIEEKSIEPKIYATGRIDVPPRDLISIHSRTKGFIQQLFVLPGDNVGKGKILARLEHPDFIDWQKNLRSLKIEMELAEREYQRKKLLIDKDAIAVKLYDEAKSTYEVLQIQYEAEYEKLAMMGFNTENVINGMGYQKFVDITAPLNGSVSSVSVNRGQLISPEHEMLQIFNMDHLHLELDILMEYASLIQLGMRVSFTVFGLQEIFDAHVVKINPAIDLTRRTMGVHCHIEKPLSKFIKPGLQAQASIFAKEVKGKGLPLGGVIRDGEVWYGFRVSDSLLHKEKLNNAVVVEDFILFDLAEGWEDSDWITEGVYYIDHD